MRMTIEAFEALPEDVQKQVRSHLRTFNECNVVFDDGKFEVGGGTCIKAVYGSDHKFHGVVYADDIYTPEERICNYIETFHDFPPQYKGKRNYVMLNWLKMMRRDGREIPIRLVDGTAVPPALGVFCRRCNGPVWLSELEEYTYQCFECDEDLYTIEVSHSLVVHGTKEDPGFVDPGYCDELCSKCEKETYNIPNNCVSLCAHCGAEMFPCATCDEDCDWNNDKNGCHRFQHTEEWIAAQGQLKIGDKVVTTSMAIMPNSVGTITGMADDDFPGTTEHFIVDFGKDGTCTLHKDNMTRCYFKS